MFHLHSSDEKKKEEWILPYRSMMNVEQRQYIF